MIRVLFLLGALLCSQPDIDRAQVGCGRLSQQLNDLCFQNLPLFVVFGQNVQTPFAFFYMLLSI